MFANRGVNQTKSIFVPRIPKTTPSNKVTGPGTTPRFSSILKSRFLWNLQPLQYFEVMELKGGKPKCCKTQGFEAKSAFRHSARLIFWIALRSAHFFSFLLFVTCTVVQSHAIHCPHFAGTCRHRHMSSSEDSLLSRCSLKEHGVPRNLSRSCHRRSIFCVPRSLD